MLVFKKNVLMAHNVKPVKEQTLLKFEELASEDEDDTFASFLHKFTPRDEDGLVTLVSKYPRTVHEWKKGQQSRVCRY